jgi:hypothetical protein
MISSRIWIIAGTILGLQACATTPETVQPDRLTRAEAKAAACPESLLEAGASAEDCRCIATKLYEIGSQPGAIQTDPNAEKSEIGTSSGRRDIAIGLLRVDAIEQCGLFDPDHIVAKNL